jgi:hypothetical protein
MGVHIRLSSCDLVRAYSSCVLEQYLVLKTHQAEQPQPCERIEGKGHDSV